MNGTVENGLSVCVLDTNGVGVPVRLYIFIYLNKYNIQWYNIIDEGVVAIYWVKRVLNSHSTFVTGLEFLPTMEQSSISRALKEELRWAVDKIREVEV